MIVCEKLNNGKKISKAIFELWKLLFPKMEKMHPHFHILIQVSPSYGKNKGYYISQSEFTDLWQNALKVDYKPIVDVRVIRPKMTLKIL